MPFDDYYSAFKNINVHFNITGSNSRARDIARVCIWSIENMIVYLENTAHVENV